MSHEVALRHGNTSIVKEDPLPGKAGVLPVEIWRVKGELESKEAIDFLTQEAERLPAKTNLVLDVSGVMYLSMFTPSDVVNLVPILERKDAEMKVIGPSEGLVEAHFRRNPPDGHEAWLYEQRTEGVEFLQVR